MKLLLLHGAHVNPKKRHTRRSTALHRAAYYGHLEVVMLLVQNDACRNALNESYQTPLQCTPSDAVRAYLSQVREKQQQHEKKTTKKKK